MTKQLCAKLCNDCAKTCMKCVSDYKKATGKKKEMLKKCAELCHCCAIICKACCELCKCCKDSCCLKEQCKVCAKVCECCMKECKKHMKHHAQCKKCYDVCKKCSTKCKAMCKPSKKLKGGMSNGPNMRVLIDNLLKKLSIKQLEAIRNYKSPQTKNQPLIGLNNNIIKPLINNNNERFNKSELELIKTLTYDELDVYIAQKKQ